MTTIGKSGFLQAEWSVVHVPVGGVVSSPSDEHVWHHGRQCDGGACVEIAPVNEAIMVRSSVRPDTVLTWSRDEWQAFRADVKAGLFDEV